VLLVRRARSPAKAFIRCGRPGRIRRNLHAALHREVDEETSLGIESRVSRDGAR